jgi:hypothetical protein
VFELPRDGNVNGADTVPHNGKATVFCACLIFASSILGFQGGHEEFLSVGNLGVFSTKVVNNAEGENDVKGVVFPKPRCERNGA